MIEKFVSPFIQSQFPQFYNDQGPNFIAFMQAYYEWAEQSNLLDNASGMIGKARSLLNYLDIDTTDDRFIDYFTNTYISSFPVSIISDRQLLVKHILELYRTKGTPRAYQLLFRMIFNEDIDLYIPGDFVFKTSDNYWSIPHYIETTDNPYLTQLVGQTIYTASGSATAVVESTLKKIINNKHINIFYLTGINGKFKYGDKILCKALPQLTIDNTSTIIGSLTAISILQGGIGYKVGDILSINGGGINGKVRVAATIDQNGKVIFTLINGGSGFSTSPTITIATTINLNISMLTATTSQNAFSIGDTILDTSTNANGYVTRANSTFVEIINYTGTPQYNFANNDTISNLNGSTATINGVYGGSGAGASFQVGGLVNQEIYIVNPDLISSYQSTIIDAPGAGIGFNVFVTGETGVFTVGNTATSSANTVLLEGIIKTANICANGESLVYANSYNSGLVVYDSEGSNSTILLSVTGSDANLTRTGLVPGITLTSNISSSQVLLTDVNPKQTIAANGTIYAQNTTCVSVQFSSGVPHGYYITGATITDTQTGHTATVNNTIRTTNWGSFYGWSGPTNLDTQLSIALASINKQVGTIAYLSNINPGLGYTTVPYISVVEPLIAGLQESDAYNGGIKGNNAIINGQVINAKGIVTAVQVVDSGFSYNQNETVYMSGANNQSAATGVTILLNDGAGSGAWTSDKSFVSDTSKLIDSYYYQNYSYEIGAMRMFNTYSDLVKKLIHPSGLALFGKYMYKDYNQDSSSTSVYLSGTQNSTNTFILEYS